MASGSWPQQLLDAVYWRPATPPNGCLSCQNSATPDSSRSRMWVRVWGVKRSRGPRDTLPALAARGVSSTYHDGLVAHVELGLSGDQGLLVLLDDQGDPAKGIQVLSAGKARGKSARSPREGGPGRPQGRSPKKVRKVPGE